MQALGQPLDHAGDGDLVDHLGQLTGARIAHATHGLGVGFEDRDGASVGVDRRAHHDGELAVLRPRLAAGHRGVEEGHAGSQRQLGHFPRHPGRGGGVVDDQAALHDLERFRHHAAHVVVIADTEHQGVHAARRLRDRRAGPALVGFRPAPRLIRAAVEHAELMALCRQMAGHGEAHHPQTHESDLHPRHLLLQTQPHLNAGRAPCRWNQR